MIKGLKIFFIVLIALFYTVEVFAAGQRDYIIFEGKKREYIVHFPANYSKQVPPALVIILHGGSGSAERMEKVTKYDALADEKGFIACYPDAFEGNWNDGREVIQSRASRLNVNDVGFISALIYKLEMAFDLDPGKVYITGVSNGGTMTLRLACELSDKIAAAAAVIANVPEEIYGTCKPKQKVPIIIMNGTQDPLMPYNGGYVTVGRRTRGKVKSTDETVKLWIQNNNCDASAPLIEKIHKDINDSVDTEKITYKSKDKDDAEVILYKINNGGHTWPGGPQYLPERIIGKASKDVVMEEEIWNFFEAHVKGK
jgi:polyhydroxybutyrate depolymerase